MRVLLAAVTAALLVAPAGAETETQTFTMPWGPHTRTYRVHTGERAQPHCSLVMVLHGEGGNAHSAERQLGFSELADEQGFVVVYPNAVDKNWNDGRNDPPGVSEIDDIGFLGALLDACVKQLELDPQRVFVTGPGLGGVMCQRVGLQLAGRVAAVAPVNGGLAVPLATIFAPSQPVSVLMIQGKNDPWVPYRGGSVRILGGRERGAVLPTEETVGLWVKTDECAIPPATQRLADEQNDGCQATLTRYGLGRQSTEVVLVEVEGGGHTWPGGSQFLPDELIGRLCRDFSATRMIWDFFQAHPRKAS